MSIFHSFHDQPDVPWCDCGSERCGSIDAPADCAAVPLCSCGKRRDALAERCRDCANLCACGHSRSSHADCGRGPCRSNVSIALWRDSNDRKTVACRCGSYHKKVETVEVPG